MVGLPLRVVLVSFVGVVGAPLAEFGWLFQRRAEPGAFGRNGVGRRENSEVVCDDVGGEARRQHGVRGGPGAARVLPVQRADSCKRSSPVPRTPETAGAAETGLRVGTADGVDPVPGRGTVFRTAGGSCTD